MSFPSNELMKGRLDGFIAQIQIDVQKDKPGVYIVSVNDLFCRGTQAFTKSFTEANIRYVEEAGIEFEENLAALHKFDTITQHLQTRNTRTHTIILTYMCRGISNEIYFWMSGPI